MKFEFANGFSGISHDLGTGLNRVPVFSYRGFYVSHLGFINYFNYYLGLSGKSTFDTSLKWTFFMIINIPKNVTDLLLWIMLISKDRPDEDLKRSKHCLFYTMKVCVRDYECCKLCLMHHGPLCSAPQLIRMCMSFSNLWINKHTGSWISHVP